eukprot:1351100-Rhodomonas_salina.1
MPNFVARSKHKHALVRCNGGGARECRYLILGRIPAWHHHWPRCGVSAFGGISHDPSTPNTTNRVRSSTRCTEHGTGCTERVVKWHRLRREHADNRQRQSNNTKRLCTCLKPASPGPTFACRASFLEIRFRSVGRKPAGNLS